MNRRTFIRTTGIATAATAVAGNMAFGSSLRPSVKNAIPRWRGFNLLDYFGPSAPRDDSRSKTTKEDLKWMADWGFDFVRLPMAYPRYINFDRQKDVTPADVLNINEKVVDEIQELVFRANEAGLHMSINLHRAPGYCVNAGFNEPYNLWKDQEALDAFCFHWEMWGNRFKNTSSKNISFDLVNEPSMREDMNDQFGARTTIPGAVYRKVALAASTAIRKSNPNHLVVADGNDVGSSVIPEITDLNIAQSCRGYFPHYISHYRASWVFKNPDDSPNVVWPGVIDGKHFSRKNLEELYQPWIDLVKQGVGVHCGECGCYRETPHEVFLAWFGDVLDVLTENQIGYALWNFRGDFGVLDSGRKDVQYEDWYGHKLDRKMLDLLKKH
ncbi:MAG: cellulase family glycosylhydrolase, partial [Bacteroidota bacterium]|nr:cellulase family glycosylhydrolase [Bacteroidota bacterium]